MKNIGWYIRQLTLTIGTPETQKTRHPELDLAEAEADIDTWQPGELPVQPPTPPTAGQ